MNPKIFTLFVFIFQISDMLTTIIGLNLGYTESNPIPIPLLFTLKILSVPMLYFFRKIVGIISAKINANFYEKWFETIILLLLLFPVINNLLVLIRLR